MLNKYMTKQEAIEKGEKFFDGELCIKCNTTTRRVNRNRCRECERRRFQTPKTKAQQKRYQQSERGKLMGRRFRLKKFWGLTEDQFETMSALQNHRCAICEKQAKLCVDHDHLTGKIRALLCANCNHILGKAYDDPAILRKAVNYLEENK
jgi:Recombination endonuclease VII